MLLFAAIAGLFLAQASVYWSSVIDDSYITFRFVRRFAAGEGWVFNAGGPRVEGFTNFLWAVLLLVPEWLRWDLMASAKLLGLASAVLALFGAWRLTAAIRGRESFANLIAPLFLALNPHFAHWALMGLETQLQVALLLLTYWRFECDRRTRNPFPTSALLAFLCTTVRIDSVLYLWPLGLYGLSLWWTRRATFQWGLRWALIAIIPALAFHGWRLWYFGDPLPNTYYAKQRLADLEEGGRGLLQLCHFVMDPARASATAAVPELRWIGWLFLSAAPALAWIQLWTGALMAGIALAAASAAPRRFSNAPRALRHRAFGVIPCLVLLPLATGLWMNIHVEGDWMPNFRFLQVATAFLSVGIAAAIPDFALLLPIAPSRKKVVQQFTVILVVYLTIVNGYQQTKLLSLYIFGESSIHAALRPARWWQPAEILANYQKPFSPVLPDVSEYLLEHTQDNATIFMSDIGQPLWFAHHLNLLDVDGLTDSYLSHAPSRRGYVPTVGQIHGRKTAFIQSDLLSAKDAAQLWKDSLREEFDLFLKRNAVYVMEQQRPEYLLLFINHSSRDPTSEGYVYPAISAAVQRHPAFANYVEIGALPKIGNVYNHLYRRADVSAIVPTETIMLRYAEVRRRNPRLVIYAPIGK